jgi:hypothetical protein
MVRKAVRVRLRIMTRKILSRLVMFQRKPCMLQNTELEKRRGFRCDKLEAAIGSIMLLVSRSRVV